MAQIDEIFFLPPMAVARLGASEIPLVNFNWLEDPSLHGAGLTVIAPAVSLNVLADGSVQPSLPATIQFRDGGLLRPVAPFFELWARIDGEEQPLTLQLLEKLGGALNKLTYNVSAANRKAARRAGDPACAFSASILVAGDDHERHMLLAASSAGSPTDEPLVSAAKPIPFGSFQVMRPISTQAMGVDLGILRVRFTPAKGEVYGPTTAGSATDPDTGRTHTMVLPRNQILNPKSSWMHYTSNGRVDSPEPADTYDGADDSGRQNRSFGVVDDTCDILLEASVTMKGTTFTGTARAFSAPPDFAPDRRPFVSLADELIDRDPPTADTKEDPEDAIMRLGDLFQRVFETASLANLDMMRQAMMPGNNQGLVNFANMPSVSLPDSMTDKDPLFDKTEDLNSPPTSHDKVPYASVAEQVHGPKADTDDMELFLRSNASRVQQIIRPAHAHFKNLQPNVKTNQRPNPTQRDPRIQRDGEHDMRMPPYMRDSDALPLSLNRRQYEFLMQIVAELQPVKGKKAGVPDSTSPTQSHVSRVLQRLGGKTARGGKQKSDKAVRNKRGKN